ncbi:MAG TPA: leucyl aminopeptidase [Gemmatimonadales bacterium]|nr:leucyl aminopeptidase [Gemmatimonadales bacterium]
MNSTLITKPLIEIETPLLAIAVPASTELPASLAPIDQITGGAVSRALASGDFKGKRDETLLAYGTGKARRVLLVGVGKPAEVTHNIVRRAAAVAAKRARALGTGRYAFAIASEARNGLAADAVAQATVEGAAHGGWAFIALKRPSDDLRGAIAEVDVVGEPADAKQAEVGRVRGDAIAAGHLLARELQMQPGNVCTPTYLANQAQALGKTHGFPVTVLGPDQIRQEGMGGLLGVSQGSAEEPRFIILEWRGAGDAAPAVIVGKGITFDSGGISIKPAANMEEMKYDMSGAAAVLGTFEVLGRLRPKLNVVGIVAASENLPSGTALKPGDVIKSHFGKTIEIVNTDAEGRLVLCDALSYVRRYNPAAVLDAATLTGAIVIALGTQASGIMGNDDALVEEVRSAGERAGERCWPLPLWEEYRDLVKSDIADVKNSGGRGAGSITGGWFLREFVEGFPWVHIDIAGTAYTESEATYQSKGPTAFGVRLFTEFLLRRSGA